MAIFSLKHRRALRMLNWKGWLWSPGNSSCFSLYWSRGWHSCSVCFGRWRSKSSGIGATLTKSLTKSWVQLPGAQRGSPQSQNGDTASDPNGALSFIDAVNKKLGLKMVEVKRPEPALVIDHIDWQPTPN